MKRCIAALPSSAINDPEIVKILASFDEWPRSDALSRLGLERLNAHLKASSDRFFIQCVIYCAKIIMFYLYTDNSPQINGGHLAQTQRDAE